MSEARKTADECREALRVLKAEWDDLAAEEMRLNERLRQIKERFHELHFPWRDTGELPAAKEALAAAERWEADQLALHVRIEPPDQIWDRFNGKHMPSPPVVLVKVTAHRIYTRAMGTTDGQRQWNHDGTSVEKWRNQRIHPVDLEKIHESQVRK